MNSDKPALASWTEIKFRRALWGEREDCSFYQQNRQFVVLRQENYQRIRMWRTINWVCRMRHMITLTLCSLFSLVRRSLRVQWCWNSSNCGGSGDKYPCGCSTSEKGWQPILQPVLFTSLFSRAGLGTSSCRRKSVQWLHDAKHDLCRAVASGRFRPRDGFLAGRWFRGQVSAHLSNLCLQF